MPGTWLASPQSTAGASLDWVSISDYGAVGDGTTDDTNAIQAAMNATPAGGVCFFPVPDSFYVISDTLDVPHGMRLAGGGNFGGQWTRIDMVTRHTTAIQGPPLANPSDPNGSYWAMDGIQLIGEWALTETAGAGVASTTSLAMSRCSIIGFRDVLTLTSTSAAEPVFYTKLDHCVFDGATRDGVRLDGICNNFTWRDCRANANGGAGVHVVGSGALSVRIEGGGFDNNGIGIDIDGETAGVLLSGLYIESPDGAGNTDIRIGNTATVYAARIESVAFIKPSFTGVGTHILATNVNGLTITDCELTSSGAAVNVSSPATNVTYGRNRNRNAGTITLPSGSIRLDSAAVTPEPVGAVAAAGTSHYLARADHVHEGDGSGSAATGHYEVVVSGNPATAVTTADGTDWLYTWVED